MLLPYFEWLGNQGFSKMMGESVWLSAMIQAFHLLCLAVFAGAVLIVDLRLLGRGLRERPLSQVAADASPWLIWSFVGLIITGVPQLMAYAIKEYYSIYFWIKTDFFIAAVIFTWTVRRRVTQADETRVGPFWAKVVGLVSIILWAGVAIPARLIGLLS